MSGGKYGVYKILSGIVCSFIGYHKFIPLIDRKIGQRDLGKREKLLER